ncbi:hypothetical protein F3Y22_tig00110549pilonHSYRG00098 [Hibiscus syriacus]|uniref:LIM zinc-binding domain-containing protein n=1 Tax=Hibiscus syriacus TaxID=106335 RepID=A0A6A3A987_HIBSY|nr:hypothetical protein F3Y22_tig00110549pilonHSYRG00098 [Hibiscus syriacus]
MAFTGTLDKCKACDKTVYVVDLMTLEGVPYHKTCFRCSHCKGYFKYLSFPFRMMSTYSWMDGVLYCKTHFEQTFQGIWQFQQEFSIRTPSKLSSMFSGTQTSVQLATKRCTRWKRLPWKLFMVKGNYNHVLQAATHRRNSSTSSTDLTETLATREETADDDEDQSKEASDD